MPSATVDIRIDMLGRFRVRADEHEISEDDWPSRRAQELVALLALADGHRLVRDSVIEQLWPHLGAKAGAANLRKAAHHARRVLDDDDAVVLRGGQVHLFPSRAVVTDVEDFLHRADAALHDGDPAACAGVAETCPGDLLPLSPYEAWTQEPRREVRARLTDLLRRAANWERLMQVDPTDEAACRELMRAAIAEGQRHVAIRWYEQLRIALVRELGARPGPETQRLYDDCTTGVRLGEQTLVGRQLEVARVMGRLQEARAGETVSILVRGPTGIGKSALCREVLDRAREDGWRVVGATGTAARAPYGPLGAFVEQLLLDGRDPLAGLPARTRSILAELTPLAGPAEPLEGAVTRHQVVAALRRAIMLSGSPVPTVLCLEDAHLCDEATAGVLHQLVAGGGALPVAVILAYRTEWLRASLPHGLAELAAHDQTLHVELGPLEDAEIVRLVESAGAEPPDPELVAQVVRRAEGSPFFALELARGRAQDASGDLPRTVRAAVMDRFVGLDRDDLDVLAKLAVAGEPLDLASVLALTGLPEGAAFAALDAALAAGALVVADTKYRFRHELVRQALTDELAPHHRLALHRDAAGRLIAAGAPPQLIAHHWLKGERPQEALPWLLRAARRAVEVGAFADALVQVDRLLQHQPDHVEALSLRAEILDALGDNRAPDAYATAAAAVGEPEAQELKARQALAQLKASDPDSALATLRGVRPTSLAGRLAEALTLSAAAAIGRYADAETAAAKAEEARRLAIELGDPGAILDATWAHALAAHATGDLPVRLREYLRSTRDLPALATRVFDGQLCVTERMLYGGLPSDEIITFADGLAAEARRLGAARGEAFARTLRGEVGVLAGHLDEADHDFAEGARLHARIGAAAGEALSLLGRGQVATYRGRSQEARRYLAEALVMARESEVGHHTLDRIYGAMVAAAADPEAGVAVVREAETAIAGPAETCPTCRIAFIVPAAIAAARAGDLERADRYAGDCERALEVIALPPAWSAAVAEVRGWVALAHGRGDAARGHFRAAAEEFDTWAQPLDAERCARLAEG